MMDIKLKGLGKNEINEFKNLGKERNKVIESGKNQAINPNYPINELANIFHPEVMHVIVTDIDKETDNVKTFTLEPDIDAGTTKLANFRPGQYISLNLKIHDKIYQRPYSISCSPKTTLQENKYTITVKQGENDYVSGYLLNKIGIGSSLTLSAPLGNFYYQPLRDAKNIIAIVGGSGITSIISLALAIFDGIVDANLVILYGNKTKNDIIFKEKLDDIICKTDKVKVVHVLSNDDDTEYEHGYITKDLIDKYISEETSFFVCGPIEMLRYINDILKEYSLPKKYIRHDLFMSDIDIKTKNEFDLTLEYNDNLEHIKCYGDKTLLQAIEMAGLPYKSRCRVGECGYCRSKLISGKVKTFDTNLRNGDRKYLYIHPCSTYPESDVVLKLPF